MTDNDALSDLRKRLDRLEAAEAIRQLKYRYWRACDSKDPDGFRDCFVPEGADIDYGPALGVFSDREPLVELYAALALRRDGDHWLYNDIHHGIHPSIDVHDDDTAEGTWTFWFMRVDLDEKIIVQQSMEYQERYVVQDGRWLIQKSRVTALTGVSTPLPQNSWVAPGPAQGALA